MLGPSFHFNMTRRKASLLHFTCFKPFFQPPFKEPLIAVLKCHVVWSCHVFPLLRQADLAIPVRNEHLSFHALLKVAYCVSGSCFKSAFVSFTAVR